MPHVPTMAFNFPAVVPGRGKGGRRRVRREDEKVGVVEDDAGRRTASHTGPINALELARFPKFQLGHVEPISGLNLNFPVTLIFFVT